MKWTKDSHLTDDQIDFISCAGGAIRLTSYVSGISYTYSVQTTPARKGLVVRHIDNGEAIYVGFLPFNGHGMARKQLVHTNASHYSADHPVFQAFRWAWANKQTDKFESKCLLTNA